MVDMVKTEVIKTIDKGTWTGPCVGPQVRFYPLHTRAVELEIPAQIFRKPDILAFIEQLKQVAEVLKDEE